MKSLKKGLEAIGCFKARKEIRYFLNCVSIYYNAYGEIKAIAATNGHVMGVYGDHENLRELNRFTIKEADLKKVVALIEDSSNIIFHASSMDSSMCIDGVNFEPLECNSYPDVSRVMNKAINDCKDSSGTGLIGIDFNYLALINNAIKKIKAYKKYNTMARMKIPGDPCLPVVIEKPETEHTEKLTAIVMPCRI